MKLLAPKWILGVAVLWGGVVAFWAVWGDTRHPTPEAMLVEPGREAPDVTQGEGVRSSDGTTLSEKKPSPQQQVEVATPPQRAPTATTHADDRTARAALAGLGMRSLTSADRETLKVPARWSGVVVSSVEPDSSADAIDLRVGDVVVQAGRKKIEQAADLEEAVGSGDHIVLTVVREGFLFQRVLQPPFEGSSPPSARTPG